MKIGQSEFMIVLILQKKSSILELLSLFYFVFDFFFIYYSYFQFHTFFTFKRCLLKIFLFLLFLHVFSTYPYSMFIFKRNTSSVTFKRLSRWRFNQIRFFSVISVYPSDHLLLFKPKKNKRQTKGKREEHSIR